MDTETVWGRTLTFLQEQMPAPAFTTWLKDTMLVGIGKGVARIKVPSSHVASWLERRLYWLIVGALRDILPEKAVTEVQFVTA
jgi:chromosomal replication initiation ATPase DnaA